MSEQGPPAKSEILDQSPPERWKELVRLALMCALAGGILWFLFRRVDRAAVLEAWHRSDGLRLGLSLGIGLLALHLVNMWGLFRSLGSVGFTGRWLPFFLATSALQLAAALQVHLSSVGYLAYMKRRHGILVRHAMGSGGVLYFGDAIVFTLVCLPAYSTLGAPYGRGVSWFALLMALILLHSYGYFKGWWDRLWLKPFPMARRPRQWEIVQPFVRASGKLYWELAGIRLLAFVIMALMHGSALAAFGVRVPFFTLILLMPLTQFLGNLPVTFGGFGTTQAATLFFLGSYGEAESILTYSLSFSVAYLLFRIVLGLLTLGPGSKELLASSEPPPA